METHIDLYQALRDLIDKIPAGMVSTPLDLARALGDVRASRAILEALQRGELRDAAGRIVGDPSSGALVFRDFRTEGPLKRLAELQREMSKRVVSEDRLPSTERIAGVDASYRGDTAYAACVVMDSGLRVIESASAAVGTRFPYIPGYLSFREAPAVEAAANLVSGFDVLLVNGHGIAHPRGCGLASHVGLDLEVATIGVAKRRLVRKVGMMVEDGSSLRYRERVVGARLKEGGHAPIYVSVGHNISLKTSVDIIRKTMAGGRLPEPLRRAHQVADRLRLQGNSCSSAQTKT